MNIEKNFFKYLFFNIYFSLKVNFLASHAIFFMKCIILIMNTIFPIISLWIWKELLNVITQFKGQKGIKELGFLLAMYVIIQVVIKLIQEFQSYTNSKCSERVNFYIEKVMIEKVSRMDLELFDSTEMGDKIRRIRGNFNLIQDAAWMVFYIISQIMNIIVTFSIISSFNIYIGIFTILLIIPHVIWDKIYANKMLKIEKEQIRDRRKLEYYSDVFFNKDVQFEIKLNSIGSYFLNKLEMIWKKLYKTNRKEDFGYSILAGIFQVIEVGGELVTLILSIKATFQNKIGIGDIQYNLNIVSRLHNEASELMRTINQFLIYNTKLMELNEFIKLEPIIEKSGERIPTQSPKIEFVNVSFHYPNTEEYVLKNCSFTIEREEKIGLIGINGSGKSTIIKLLFRFYDPQEGKILLEGKDLKEYNVYLVRKIFGVLFQDYVTYCLPFREIIALSDFKSVNDNDKIKKACDFSGVSEFISNWKDKYDTILGRFYADNGKDLSGGQWQLVGLARAYLRVTKFMILDEPSAALDPIAEDRIFEQLYLLGDKKSSITISHRLSNTMLADKILVLENGKIIEEGSHKELLNKKGKYSYLFQLQASKYI